MRFELQEPVEAVLEESDDDIDDSEVLVDVSDDDEGEYGEEEECPYADDPSLTDFQRKVYFLERHCWKKDNRIPHWQSLTEKPWAPSNTVENTYERYFLVHFGSCETVRTRKYVFDSGRILYDQQIYADENNPNFPSSYGGWDGTHVGVCDLCLDPEHECDNVVKDACVPSYRHMHARRHIPAYKRSRLDYMVPNPPPRDIDVEEFAERHGLPYSHEKVCAMESIRDTAAELLVLVRMGVRLPAGFFRHKRLRLHDDRICGIYEENVLDICDVLHRHGMHMPASVKRMKRKSKVMEELYTTCICGKGRRKAMLWKFACYCQIVTELDASEESARAQVRRFNEDICDTEHVTKQEQFFKFQCDCLCACGHRNTNY